MKILKGFVQGVKPMGTAEKPWAMVGISEVSVNRNGFEETTLHEIMVAGKQYKEGLHNAYRQHEGSEVFAPVRDEIDTYGGKPKIKHSLQGVPLLIQEAPPVLEPRPSQAEQQRPSPAPVQQAKTA